MKQNTRNEISKIFWYLFVGTTIAIITTFAIGQIRQIFPEDKEILGQPFPIDSFLIIMFSIILALVLYLLNLDKRGKLN